MARGITGEPKAVHRPLAGCGRASYPRSRLDWLAKDAAKPGDNLGYIAWVCGLALPQHPFAGVCCFPGQKHAVLAELTDIKERFDRVVAIIPAALACDLAHHADDYLAGVSSLSARDKRSPGKCQGYQRDVFFLVTVTFFDHVYRLLL